MRFATRCRLTPSVVLAFAVSSVRIMFHRTKRQIRWVTIAIAIASVGAGASSAAQAAAPARAAATPTVVCADVTGDPWTYPGPGEPGGVAYVVIAQNLDCRIAQLLANNLVLGAPGFKSFKCKRRTQYSGDCRRTVRRRHQRTVQVFGWYPDFGHPNGP